MGVFWIYPDACPFVCPPVRLSVRPSLDKISGTFFFKYYWLNLFYTRHLPLWVESLDPYSFACSSGVNFHPLVDKYLTQNGVSGFKTISSNFFKPGNYPFRVSLLTPIIFWWSWCQFRPSGGQIFGRKWAFCIFLIKLTTQFILYLAFTLMMWLYWPQFIFVFPSRIAALWCQMFRRKMVSRISLPHDPPVGKTVPEIVWK